MKQQCIRSRLKWWAMVKIWTTDFKLSIDKFFESATREWPNTKWKFVLAMNMAVLLQLLKNFQWVSETWKWQYALVEKNRVSDVLEESVCNYLGLLIVALLTTTTWSGKLPNFSIGVSIDIGYQMMAKFEEYRWNQWMWLNNSSVWKSAYDIKTVNEKLVDVFWRRRLTKYSKPSTVWILRIENVKPMTSLMFSFSNVIILTRFSLYSVSKFISL